MKMTKVLIQTIQRYTSVYLQSCATRGMSNRATKQPIVTLYTKENCLLCDEAKILLTPLSHRFELQEVDITLPENKQWFIKYRYEIPVFHFNGEFFMKNKVDLYKFEQTLTKYENVYGRS